MSDETSDTTTITPEERERLRGILSEHGNGQVEDRIILRLLNTAEQAEARADELEDYIAKLVSELTDGKLSKPYDISVITDEVEAIYRAYSEDEIAKSTEKAEAEVMRLTKERDWLATQLACIQSAYDIDQKTRDWSTARWAEAARRAVADSEAK